MTYTKSQTSGPSEVADGYYEGDLQGAYDAWKSAFEGAAGYMITFDEIEEFDSEVAYRGGAEVGPASSRSAMCATKTGASPCTSPAVRRNGSPGIGAE